MNRSIIRAIVATLAAVFVTALAACAGLPSSQMPLAQDTHDYVGGEN